MKIKALYIHVPFCASKCNYCDFNSQPLPVLNRRVDDYLTAIKRELQLYTYDISLDEVETVYIGGGTPTLLETKQLVDLMLFLHTVVDFSRIREATIEANPGTINRQKLLELKKTGLNRISIGVQSFDDTLLKNMGRIHTAGEAVKAVEAARNCGWDNINIDLIYGLPHQTTVAWKDTLNKAGKLQPDHISAYGLTIEDNAQWGKDYSKGKFKLPDEEKVFEMYQILKDTLSQRGYIHYEISNYCKPYKESKHNSVYWENKYYLGIGGGAASFYAGKRFYNIKDTCLYLDGILKGIKPIEEIISLTKEEEMSETMFMNLRLLTGVSIKGFKKRFGLSPLTIYMEEIKKLARMGLVDFNMETIKITKKAIPLANLVFQEFIN